MERKTDKAKWQYDCKTLILLHPNLALDFLKKSVAHSNFVNLVRSASMIFCAAEVFKYRQNRYLIHKNQICKK